MSETSFTVSLWLCTTAASERQPALASDKDWDAGALVDVTSHHDFGWTRDSGLTQGWSIALGVEGTWVWNAADGRNRLDYRPPAPAGVIADGAWHHLAFSIDADAAEAILYLDGQIAAIYSTAGLGEIRSGEAPVLPSAIQGGAVEIEDLRIDEHVVDHREIQRRWQARGNVGAEEEPLAPRVEQLRVMAWNIWHGGRRDGDREGLEATIAAIRAAKADVVAMQETYGSGAHIAAGLGYHYYLRSSNLSIMSRFPIRETHDLYEPFRLGGVTLELSPGQFLKLFSLWIHYLPDYGGLMRDGGAEVAAAGLVAAEMETRGREIDEILTLLQPHLDRSDVIPVIVAGDFNSPSHLDWTQETRARHRDLVVEWPVSRAMAAAGFVDGFRTVHADAAEAPGFTWSPRFTDAWKDRIDFVYLHGTDLHPASAAVHDQQSPRWPSDHAAVVVEIELQSPASGAVEE